VSAGEPLKPSAPALSRNNSLKLRHPLRRQVMTEGRISNRDAPVDLPATPFYREVALKDPAHWDEDAILPAKEALLAEMRDPARHLIGEGRCVRVCVMGGWVCRLGWVGGRAAGSSGRGPARECACGGPGPAHGLTLADEALLTGGARAASSFPAAAGSKHSGGVRQCAAQGARRCGASRRPCRSQSLLGGPGS
jgi:hypothetical protein